MILEKGDTYEMCNGTQIDGTVFCVKDIISDEGETWYIVTAYLPNVFEAGQQYFVPQHAIDLYYERNQIRDAIRECAV